jgi:hypothetical protein
MALNLEVMNCKRERRKVGITYVNELSRNSFDGPEDNHKKK